MSVEGRTPSFDGMQVAAFESRHTKEMAALISRYGGVPRVAPSVREVPVEDNSPAWEFGKMLLDGQFDAVVFMTGVGTQTLARALETRYSREQITQALSKVRVIARGPKAIRALRELNVPIAITVPNPHTWQMLLTVLDGQPGGFTLQGSRIAIQEYGASNPDLLDELANRGAQVFRIPVYRWALPDDLSPLQEVLLAIVQGGVRVVLFTSAVQVDHVTEAAADMGVTEKFETSLTNIVVCSVGPTCSQALRNRGIPVHLEANEHKMGSLVFEAARLSSELLQKKGETT
jgi:uroporphyrinogen-III synthase